MGTQIWGRPKALGDQKIDIHLSHPGTRETPLHRIAERTGIACRHVGIEEAVHDALTGHTGNSVSRKYGNEQYPLEPLFEAMERFEIVDLNLSHLYKRRLKRNSNKDLKLIAAFYGVMIGFSAARSNKQQAPFVMAFCDGAEAAVEVASNKLLFGQLPANKLLLVNAWVEIHREELLASWHAGRITGDYFKLDPLR